MKVPTLIIFLLFPVLQVLPQQFIKGVIQEFDSTTAMPFVYIINKSSGNGTMSDNIGRFSLSTNENDTIVCSYVGFFKAYVPVKSLKTDENGLVKIYMRPMPVELGQVTVTTFKIKPYERQYMNDIIEKSTIRNMDYAMSPFSALYMQYSKEGKQIRKLAKIFEEILMEEQVQKKFNRDILVKLTGDENIDYLAFRKYCYYVNDYFIVTHDGVDLYSKVMECYKNWKNEHRGEPPRRREVQQGE